MNRTVREHIEKLEMRRKDLNLALMSGQEDITERNRLETEIRAVTVAIDRFHAALLAEQDVFNEK